MPARLHAVVRAVLFVATLAVGSAAAKDGGSGSGGGHGSGSNGSGGSGGGANGQSRGGGQGSGGDNSGESAGAAASHDAGRAGEAADRHGGDAAWSPAGFDGEGRDAAHRDQDLARDAVASGATVPLARVLPTVRQAVAGDVLDVRLRRRGGALIYDVTILSTAGEYRSIAVDARRNRIIGSEQR